jgi:hypothetical protein
LDLLADEVEVKGRFYNARSSRDEVLDEVAPPLSKARSVPAIERWKTRSSPRESVAAATS